jgi:hypothetical protein
MKRFLIVLALSSPSAAVLAQQPAGRAACATDAQRFCGGASQAKDCLLDHQQDISQACYDFLKESAGKGQSAGAKAATAGAGACLADVPKFCKGVKPGGGRIKDCLIDHQQDISQGCYDFLSKQKSGDAGSAEKSAPAPTTIIRSKQANGHVSYSDTPQPDAEVDKEVQIPGGNTSVAPR